MDFYLLADNALFDMGPVDRLGFELNLPCGSL